MTAATATATAATAAADEAVHLLPQTDGLRALHTVIRDRGADRADFVACSARIIRRLLETSLELLPFDPQDVQTPVGRTYHGLRATGDVCAVSVARAGESMESEVRVMAPAMRIGKILIQRDRVTKLPRLYYSALPADIARRSVLLLDPMLATGGTALAALGVLAERGVPEEHIVFVNLLSAPEGIEVVRRAFPKVRLVTSSVEEKLNENALMLPGIGDFGDRYFGTDVPV